MKLVVSAVGVAAAVVGLVIGLAFLSGSAVSSAATSTSSLGCLTTGPIPGLSPVAATNARIVTGIAEQRTSSAGAVVAVMVGLTESGLRVLLNPSVDTGDQQGQGTGSDHDSLGIFQQRPSWGSVAQRLDPAQSTTLFIARLVSDRGWQQKQPWIAAQDVQDSAYDGQPRMANHESSVYGGNYEASLSLAQQVVAAIDRDASTLACGALTGGTPANIAPGSHGLPDGYVIPPTASANAALAILFAIAQLDKPYVVDAAGPKAFDCSGLTMAAWAQAGVKLPHSAARQSLLGGPTTVAGLLPGDLVFVPGDDGTLSAPGHVGIYLGDGLVLNAADEHDGIRVQTYQNFIEVGHGLSALRHLE
jgi:peptidoglycan DL-endopeptidase CwlO